MVRGASQAIRPWGCKELDMTERLNSYLHAARRLPFHFASPAAAPDGCHPPLLRPDTSQLSSGGPDLSQSLIVGLASICFLGQVYAPLLVEAGVIQTALSVWVGWGREVTLALTFTYQVTPVLAGSLGMRVRSHGSLPSFLMPSQGPSNSWFSYSPKFKLLSSVFCTACCYPLQFENKWKHISEDRKNTEWWNQTLRKRWERGRYHHRTVGRLSG